MKNEAPVGEYWESWITMKCPCGKLNWINQGDITDLSGNDAEAARCWSCDILFWVNPEMKRDPDLHGAHDYGEINGMGEDYITHAYDVKGREKP